MTRSIFSLPVLAAATLALAVVPAAAQLALETPAPAVPAYFESIVKIENSSVSYDYGSPWNAGNYGGGSGTGFHIGDNRFLTNAHVVSGARRLMVTLPSDPTPRPASLLHIAHDCDLALFELDDPRPTENLPALEIGDIPSLDDEVRVIGYPVGGERMSLTRGVVSRIDYVGYSHSLVDQHLAVQIDAAINPGNSGGPVLQEGKVVGVAFQGLGMAENTGYMIPPPVIERFLADIEDGSYDGYVELGLSFFPLLNPAQRRALELNGDGSGVLIGHVTATGSADGVIEEGDILLSIGGLPIAADGTVQIDGERVHMAEVVERMFVGDVVPFELIRDGEQREVEVTLRPLPAYKILATDYDNEPRYVVAAGLVFQPVNRNLLEVVDMNSHISRRLQEHLGEDGFLELPDIVLFTQVLPASVNSGAEEFVGNVVESIDGEPVRTLHDVHRLLVDSFGEEDEAGEFIDIRLTGVERPLLLRRGEAAAAHEQILQRYGLRQDARLGAETSYSRARPAAAEAEADEASAVEPEPADEADEVGAAEADSWQGYGDASVEVEHGEGDITLDEAEAATGDEAEAIDEPEPTDESGSTDQPRPADDPKTGEEPEAGESAEALGNRHRRSLLGADTSLAVAH